MKDKKEILTRLAEARQQPKQTQERRDDYDYDAERSNPIEGVQRREKPANLLPNNSSAVLSSELQGVTKRPIRVAVVFMSYILFMIYSLHDMSQYNIHNDVTVTVTVPAIDTSDPVPTISNQQRQTIFQSTRPGTSEGEELCVLVRTFTGHGLALQRHIIGWAVLAEKLAQDQTNNHIQHISVYTVNTHHHQNRVDDERLTEAMHKTTDSFPDDIPMDLHFTPLPDNFVPDKQKYGYDATNHLLRLILADHKSSCDRFIITNGDNTYHNDLLKLINEQIIEEDYDLIGFDFTSHHKMMVDGIMVPNTRITTEFSRSKIDLGAAVIRRRVLTDLCQTSPFLFRQGFDKYHGPWFVSDVKFYKDAIKCNATTTVIHQVLLQHQ